LIAGRDRGRRPRLLRPQLCGAGRRRLPVQQRAWAALRRRRTAGQRRGCPVPSRALRRRGRAPAEEFHRVRIAMTGFTVYPAIDVREGRVVRLAQGDYARETRYEGAPLDVALRYAV